MCTLFLTLSGLVDTNQTKYRPSFEGLLESNQQNAGLWLSGWSQLTSKNSKWLVMFGHSKNVQGQRKKKHRSVKPADFRIMLSEIFIDMGVIRSPFLTICKRLFLQKNNYLHWSTYFVYHSQSITNPVVHHHVFHLDTIRYNHFPLCGPWKKQRKVGGMYWIYASKSPI
jgi:hypothetical protein